MAARKGARFGRVTFTPNFSILGDLIRLLGHDRPAHQGPAALLSSRRSSAAPGLFGPGLDADTWTMYCTHDRNGQVFLDLIEFIGRSRRWVFLGVHHPWEGHVQFREAILVTMPPKASMAAWS